MNEKDDQDWFDLVAGRQVPGASQVAGREAELIRRALKVSAILTSPEIIPDQDAIREQRLLDRAHAAARSTSSPRTDRIAQTPTTLIATWLGGWRSAFTVAVVLAAVSVLYLLIPHQQMVDEPDTTRGGKSTVYARRVPDPARASLLLADALTNAGIKVRRRQEGENWQVEFNMPDTFAPEAVKALERLDIRNPSPGPMLVIVEKSR